MVTEKKWKVTFTVSGIKDSDYDEIVSNIENFIEEKYLDVDTGIREEIE